MLILFAIAAGTFSFNYMQVYDYYFKYQIICENKLKYKKVKINLHISNILLYFTEPNQ